MMKTITLAEVALLEGPFTESEVIEVPSRGDKGVTFLKEKFGDALIALVFFDVLETHFQGLKFTSEPHNIERIDIISPEDAQKRINADRQELSDKINEVISVLSAEQEEISEHPRVLH